MRGQPGLDHRLPLFMAGEATTSKTAANDDDDDDDDDDNTTTMMMTMTMTTATTTTTTDDCRGAFQECTATKAKSATLMTDPPWLSHPYAITSRRLSRHYCQ